MGLRMNLLFISCLLASIYRSNGCTMEGVSIWQLPITVPIEDYHDGIILQRAVSDIGGFTLTSYNDLNGGPYVTAAIEDSSFVLRTNEAYRLFEENETEDRISLTYTFSCTNGASLPSPLTIIIEINDNNNNDPLFKTPDTAASPSTAYNFTIAPPVPPGFLITNCVSDIIVRDIDLTTYRIDFGIEDNPYFEIEYDGPSTVAKEYKAVLRTTSFIRSLPEPIVLTISATDVDLTGDPPITTYTTVTIHGSAEFELPQEPVFSEAFYFANYTEEDEIILQQPITLQQGYDEQVQFSLAGDYAANHFSINVNDNDVSISVTNPLPTEVLQQGQIYLVVNATREYTSGASATIIVQLPEVVELVFEQPHYEGEIVDNTLQPMQLLLAQGYQGSAVTATVEDYASFFTASAVGNIITLSMTTPLDESIIQENSFLNLRVTASTDSSSVTTIVTLEIVKNDVSTPVFGQPLYTGTYDSTNTLTMDPIVLVQGFDDTVNVSLSGEHESYFELIRNGASSTLQLVESLPSHILSESHLLLTVEATKPRTVGASAVVSITLPEARELRFEAISYKGSVQDNILTVDDIILNVGYDDDVTFSLSGDYSSLFAVTNVQNQATITLPAPLPQVVTSENNFILLTLTATGINTLSTSTTVLLEIIKDDVTTPVFSQPIYYGTYLGLLDIDIGNINLVQGYDSSVTFTIEGENSEYFAITSNQNVATLSVQSSIPAEVILNEKMFVFNIFADKPLTVGANAAIAIKFSEDLTEPAVMQFANRTYVGSIEDSLLTLESIVLDTGYTPGTQFILSGDYSSFFTHTVTNNVVTLSMTSELPTEVLDNNKFIVLELEARRDRAVSAVAGIIVEIVEEEIVIPAFSQAYYSGIYTEENILQFQETITLRQGYDDSVIFELEGESAEWFAVTWTGNSATILSTSAVPQDVLENYHHLLFTVVAYKPDTVNAYAAVSIDLPKDILEQEVLRFAQSSYEGQIDGSELQVPTVNLTNEITENVQVSLSGVYATYFTVSLQSNIVQIELANDLPTEVISVNEFIIIDITASKPDAVSGYATLVLSIVKEPAIITPVFEQAYYTGEVSEQGDLIFEHTIRLIQGFDESVAFTLNGDGSELFDLMITGENNLSLYIAEGGIEQIENIRHLVFSVVASKTGSVSGEAAIVIHNLNFSTAWSLRFSQNHYRGLLEENILTMESISLVEGYSPDVQFSLSGDYWNSFQLVGEDGTYTLQSVSNITAEDFEENILVLYIEAVVNDTRTHAVIIIELIKDDNTENNALEFDEIYYTASYSATNGVMADIQLRITSGYDSDTEFILEESISALFNVQHSESIVTISLATPLPVELFVSNQPLIFALNAVNSAGSTTSATIVITLEDDLTSITILEFERNNYVGTIESGTSTLEPITLIEGYSSEVNFTLKGDLSEYFTIIQQDSTVNIILQDTIPDQLMPPNLIIVLELEATSAQAISATTTIILEVEARVDPVFEAAYYIGQYSETGGLVFDTAISLQESYEEDVQFALEGDHAQWFALQVQGNSVTLTTSGAIPPAILVNNHQLVFVVTGQKPNSNIARTTIVISLVDDYTDATILGFERSAYIGTIDNNVVSLDPIVLTEGYSDAVAFTLHGDLAIYFSLQQQGSTINIVPESAIPEQVLLTNRVVIIEVRAAAAENIPAMTTVVLEIQQAVASEQLAFEANYFIGQYSETGGLVFNTTISLQEGYDQDVEFALEGDHAQWFALQVQGNSVTLTASGAIPPAILVNNHQLVFVVTAQKPNSNIARTTIVISLVDDYTDATILGFERSAYIGTIDNNVVSLDPIVLTEGYSDAVAFTLHGDLAIYFSLQQQGSTINIVLESSIPEQVLLANRVVIIEVRAAAAESIPAMTTVVLEIQQAVASEQLAFEANYYIGQYSETGGLVFNTTISLQEGYDQDVEFALEGDHAQWFALQVQGNSVTLTTSGAIPPAILVNNHQLVFVVTAQKPNSNIARTTIVISLVDDYTDATILGFERSAYIGTIDNNVVSLDPIVLTEGYSDAVAFTLHGDLAIYFSLQQQGSTINIVPESAIPEQVLLTNRVVIIEVRAAAAENIPAMTTVVLEIQQAVASEQLAFEANYFIGQYSETGGLVFNTTISLQEGYDQDVEFALEGDHAQWFALQVQGNSVTLTASGAIPPAILVNNHQLVFVVTAQKPNSNIARTTIVISLVDDYTDATILGFERSAYIGTIDNNVVSLDPIVLTEGYSDAVAFTLHGDLATYFSLQQQGSTINVVLESAIPEQVLLANRVVIIEVRAAAAESIPATTTVVLEIQQAVASEQLSFEANYYIGQYSETGGLVFDIAISLQEGYDQDVEFALEGDHAQWFALQVQGNFVTLTTSGAIPPAILVNNHQLVFVVTAQKPNSNIARTTIVISLVDDYTDATILGFERSAYIGTIDNNVVSLDPIVLTEGYSDAVAFTLHGDLAIYFSLQQQGSTINIVLESSIPEQVLLANRVVIIEVRAAAAESIPAMTTVVLEIQQAVASEQLAFEANYYIGQYSETGGLVFNTTISLQEGYDQDVEFALEGDHAQWFALQVQGNSVTLTTSGAIPPAILVNNHQLVFVVTAQKPNSNIARTTIVISLVDDYTDATILGFERSAYIGTIDNNVVSLDPIVLTEGYSDAVAFTLHGDLAIYFSLQQQGSTINIVLESTIPEQVSLANRVVIIEVRAAAAESIPAMTTVVLEIQQAVASEQLAFEANYYIGQYSETGGLVFNTTISLQEGYDQDVEFALEGDHAQWFALQVQGNFVTLTTSGAIPPAILVNNHQLVFVVTAQKPNSNIARSTIVISLVDDYTDATILGFERSTYIGTIENNVVSLDPIVLTEGYSDAVAFTLHGDLAIYFSLQQQGSTINIMLESAIPEQVSLANRVVIIEVRAAAAESIPAMTTVVLEIQQAVASEQLAFEANYYIGQYSETGGLVFNTTISLQEGYDQDVEFALEGDHAQWFALQVQGNFVTLTTSGVIPPAILVNNLQLVFVVTAQKPNSNIARTTIVISLVDDYTDATILGFERSTYIGTIDNNVVSLDPIVLTEGYSDAVAFTLHGDLAIYFSLQQQGSTINIMLESAIPEQVLLANRVVIIEVRAAAAESIPAMTTVVLEIQQAVASEQLAFEANYYIGQYSETGGLVFNTTISLQEGYDQDVEFALEGDHAQWFALQVQGNSVTLTTSGAIPPAILVNNHQLVFVVTAQKPNSNIARTTIVISLVDDYTDATILGFERSAYIGTIDNNVVSLDPIVLTEGYSDAVAFTLHGDLAIYFSLQQQGSTINIMLESAIPEQVSLANRIVIIEVRAAAAESIPAMTTVVLEIQQAVASEQLAFEANYYIGQYSETGGLVFNTTISLQEGYDQDVEFALEGDHAQWFALQVQGNFVTLTTSGAIPPAILVNNHQLVFVVTAQKPNSNIARTTIVISLVDDYTDATILGFERSTYIGTTDNNVVSLDPIVLTEGYSDSVAFTLHGDLAIYFSLQQQGSTINIVLESAIPEQVLLANRVVIIEVRAAAAESIPAMTTVVLEIQQAVASEQLAFEANYYIGQYSETGGLVFNTTISLQEGYDQDVEFALEGDHAQWFALQVQGNFVTLTTSGAIPPAILVNNHQLVFVVTAQKPNSNIARTTIVISLVDDYTDATILGFERSTYIGTTDNNVVSLDPIVLTEGYSDSVAFTLHGDLAIYFSLQQQGSTINIVLENAIPEQVLLVNRVVIIEVRAAAAESIPAMTTVVLEIQQAVASEQLAFEAAYYIGQYSETGGLVFDTAISLQEGYDNDVWFTLEGDYADWFTLSADGNSITLVVVEPIPAAILVDIRKFIMIVRAMKEGSDSAMAVVVISVIESTGTETNVAFDKVLYEGTINLNVVQHEPITVTEYIGSNIEILGVYGELFSATVSDGTVSVGASGTLGLPDDVTHVSLELRAGGASAVLVLNVLQSVTPVLPTVTFGSPNYVVRAEMSQTGLVGQVQATASNGETVVYSLSADDAHLQERVSINSEGEINLSAPTNTGVYNFQIIATTLITQVQATATVQLTVEAASTCGDDHTLPPLIILDRDEEEPHDNLIVLDSVAQAGCQFTLTNRWPADQDWLFVNGTGLHALSIDREDPRIAFMALSQVQVELVLECASDTQSRFKRSTDISSRLDWLGPYEYGSNKWILTDTILYNSRRSFVNLIVNDINDNYPIFVGIENQPIVCGYPIPELEDILLPRALAELKATDADVGENAALSFWSSEEVLAVSPGTGSVHVRNGATLEQDQILTVSVTDLNGMEGGLTASIRLLVKLIDTSHIAVVTVRNAFLDQEETILSNLSSAVGYEVKVLSSAVISDDPTDSENARNKREVTSDGASLQLYVYGVIDLEPVAVDQLANDITEHVLEGIDVTSTVSLEDYLESREISAGSDVGLLVATIVLSILLFILILAIAVWFFLRWRKARNYEQFSDANSLASRIEPLEPPPKVDTLKKPRLNIEELKRSERRLQEMLDAPVDDAAPKAQTSQMNAEETFDTIINMAPPESALPIVIQSIDKLKDDSGDEDEFGERTKKSRRKSVVTFNENVEKIIHVEDIPDDSSDVEVFKF